MNSDWTACMSGGARNPLRLTSMSSMARTAMAVAVLIFIGGCCLPATTVLLVRHAEKETGRDPGLTAAGQARARALVEVAKGAGVSAIYHTQLERTRLTAAPRIPSRIPSPPGTWQPPSTIASASIRERISPMRRGGRCPLRWGPSWTGCWGDFSLLIRRPDSH